MNEVQRKLGKMLILSFCLACEEPMEEINANYVPQDLSVSGIMQTKAPTAGRYADRAQRLDLTF